jgi:DNA-binding transcriptional regulator YdaS (Cro superfamily)
MELLKYLAAERGRNSRVAHAARLAATFLSQIANGQRPAPPDKVPAIEAACEMQVRRWDLRPDDWHRIWPELIGAEGAPAVEGIAAAGPVRAAACTCGSWEMAEDDQAVVPLAPAVADAPQPPEPEALPLAAAFALGGRREDDHVGSDFGVLDVNGDVLAAEIEARARLTGDLPVRPDEEGGDAL